MAEQTPGNLSGEFGGFAAGRAADDNRGIDRATDRLESEINRFSDALERLTGSLGGASPSNGGQQPAPGSGQQTKYANGGGATFGGVPVAPGKHSTQGGTHAADVPTSYVNPTVARASIGFGKVAAGGAVAGLAAFTANHYSSQVGYQNLASMYGGGEDWNARLQAGARGNFTAHSGKDDKTMLAMFGARSGQTFGSDGWNTVRNQAMSMSATNPAMSNTAAATAMIATGSTTSYNRMARMGINPLGAGGLGDPKSIARQILSKMGSQRVRTKAQADAAFGAAGSATVTLDSFVTNGYLPPEARDAVEQEMRNILYAQVGGMSATEYTRLAGQANTSSKARETLSNLGIATRSATQDEDRLEGKRREKEFETIGGFVAGLRTANKALGKFHEILESFLGFGKVGETVGLLSSTAGKIPGASSILSKIPFVGGDGPPSMAGSQRSYSAASGAGAASATFSGMGVQAGARPAGAGSVASSGSARSAASQYSLGAVKPWVAKAASILGSKFGIRTIGGVGSRPNPSDHPSGHALDFMCGKSAGDALAAYAIANRAALNITYVIWRQRIWNIGDQGWRPMADGGSITANHFDHVHISFLRSPTNGDYSNLPAGGGLGAGVGGGISGSAGGLGQGNSQDNGVDAGFTGSGGYSAGGKYSEVAALGLGAGGVGGAGGVTARTNSVSGDGGALGGSGGGVNLSGGYGSGASGTVRSGTYNVGSLKGRTNPAADVSKLTGPADVLALTEVNPARLAALRKGLAKDNWGVYAGDGSADGAYALDASIAYDKDKYQFVKGGTYKLGDLTGNFLGGRGKRYANYALLKDKESGMSFWQVSAHTVPMANADRPHRRMHKEQFDSLDSLAEMLKKTGIPVIMGGDFNQQRNRDFWRNPAGMSSGRGGGVDHVFGQTGMVQTTDLDMIRGLSGDHSGAVLATMSIKGTGGVARAAGNGGSPADNMALGRSLAAARGWSGGQWDALKNLWMRESGWRTNADNPSSSAYGIPQALTELHGLGNKYKSDPRTQIQWGLNYIAGRYGDPSGAWDFWQKNNYYKQGSWKIKEDKEAQIHMGEMILPSKIADVVRGELTAPGIGSRGKNGGGGVSVVFQPGSITVSIPTAGEGDARQAGRWVVDAMMEDARFKALAEGR